MKYTLKKLTAILLSGLLLVCLPLSVSAAKTPDYPIIYVPDIDEIVLYQNPNTLGFKEIFNVHSQDFLSKATGIVTGLVSAANDAEKGAAQVNSAVNSLLGPIACDEHGDSANKSIGAYTYTSPLRYNENSEINTENMKALVKAASKDIGNDKIFVFNYDWRLDPTGEGEKLCSFIDKVLASTGSKMVRLLSGGFGGIVVNSYLYKCEDHAARHISSCVFLDSMITGTSIIGDIMSGHLVYTVADALKDAESLFDLKKAYDVLQGTDVGTAFARYLKQDPGGILSAIFTSFLGDSLKTDLVSWFALTLAFDIMQDEGMLDAVGKGYKEMLVLADNGIYDGGLKELLRNMPGMWAMVPVELYDDAIDFMFGSREEADEELLEKIDAYRDVIDSTEVTLKKLQLTTAAQSTGVNVAIVAGYGMQVLPITATVNEQSDGLVSTRYAGVGARTGDMNSSIKPEKQCRYGNHNHMEPGNCVDASTCFLPENTWFIKNHNHMEYSSPTAAEFVYWLVSGTTPRTVYTNSAFPQYMQKAVLGDKVYAYSDPTNNESTNYTYGDLNIDGKVDAADARLALRYSVNLEGTPSKIITLIGDVNANGRIDAADARLILRYSVGLEKGFAPAV